MTGRLESSSHLDLDLAEARVAPDTAEWSVWSTTARIVVTEPATLAAAFDLTRNLLARIDAAASRFRNDSEILAIDRSAGAPISISPLLADLVRVALQSARETEGDVDPCLGHQMRGIGYDRDFSSLVTSVPAGRPWLTPPGPTATETLVTAGGQRIAVTRKLGWRDVQLSDDTIIVPSPLSLDLGATAKAFASDLIADVVATELGTGILVSLGGDIATSGPGPAGDWRILVSDGPGEPECRIALPPGSAIATSSTVRRRWEHEGKQVHHILDPGTGRPAQPVWRTVTVAAPSCVRANTLTTAAVVRGHGAVAWLRAQGNPARLVGEDGSVTSIGGWPNDGHAPRGG